MAALLWCSYVAPTMARLCFFTVMASANAGNAFFDPPVPFSTSVTDGFPSKDLWNIFTQLNQTVPTKDEMTQQRAMLAKYAKDQVAASLDDIKANLEKVGIKGFDFVWPGDGYAALAYGGLWAAVKELEKVGVSKVGNRAGASGGACSTILTMADNLDLFLRLYQVYQLYFDGVEGAARLAKELVRDTRLTAAIYAEATRDDIAFANAQKQTFIMSHCSKSGNTMFHGFQTHEQLVAAGFSSGDASLGGATFGTVVKGTEVQGDIGHCMDGGQVTVFPADVANKDFAVMLYSTTFNDASHPTATSIPTLFKSGVDTAIAALKSPSLAAKGSDGGSMKSALPGPTGIVTATEFAKILSVKSAKVVDLAKVDIIV